MAFATNYLNAGAKIGATALANTASKVASSKPLTSAAKTLSSYSNGASAANAVSAYAQAQQNAYNTAAAQSANNFTQSTLEQQMAFNREEAQKNRDWQEYMSNTAYQRAVEDMKKAGINPIFAYQMGGASTGTGSSASMSSGSGAMASTSNYQGQQDSGTLQLIGALLSAFAGPTTAIASFGDNMLEIVKSLLPDSTNKSTGKKILDYGLNVYDFTKLLKRFMG